MSESEVKHYFVDEAGDTTLFNKRRQIVLGKEGVSQFFMVGLAEIPNPFEAELKLEELRRELLSDPYFKDVPSMQPEKRRTALHFHAKDDPAEVRWEVMKLLPTLGAKIIVAIRRKDVLAYQYMRQYYRTGSKYSENQIYDQLISRVFHGKLHKADDHLIVFAKRGKADRQQALGSSLARAINNFESKHGPQPRKAHALMSTYPHQQVGLQIADYYLWALQRLYERRESRFFNKLRGQYRLIMDIDDTRRNGYGEYYSDRNILEASRIMPVSS